MNYSTIKYEVEDSIALITLSRPEKLNSFTIEMSNELIDAFQKGSEDDDVGAIIVTGAERAFCAGMDLDPNLDNVFGLDETIKPTLDDMREKISDPKIHHGVRDAGGKVVLSIYECKKPVIAAINGAAVGIGATMTCAMDIRFVSTKAKVGFVFNKIGITPEACSSWFLPKLVGFQTALEWCYTGEILLPETLLRERFAKEICEPEELLTKAREFAQKLVQHSQVSMALTRQMLYRNSVLDHPLKAHEIDSLSIFYASLGAGKEGVKSFLEKRAPEFTDKASTDMPDFYPWWTD